MSNTLKSLKNSNLEKVLTSGGVAVIPTDTIYGIVGSAFRKNTVERIYDLRRRDKKKPFILLISSLRDLALFGISPSPKTIKFLKGAWPGRVSVALHVPRRKWEYLHRGTEYIAFRLPAKKDLRELLKKTGPLVAPSANIEGKPPAENIKDAKKYFGDKVDLYVDEGGIVRKPSTLIKILRGKEVVLRN